MFCCENYRSLLSNSESLCCLRHPIVEARSKPTHSYIEVHTSGDENTMVTQVATCKTMHGILAAR